MEKVGVFIKYLEDNNAKEFEGILRISGRATLVQQVINQVDDGTDIKLDIDVSDACHTVATALKGYLTSTDQSVIITDMYHDFLEITSKIKLIFKRKYFNQ